ncbi:MAG: hypothetical protein AAGD11_13990 [Planctomycetota bacterium]
MSRKRRSRDRAEGRDRSGDEYADQAPERPKRWRRRLVGLLLLLAAIVAAAPTIVGRTAVRNSLLGQAMPPGWTIASEQASFGWATRQSITGLTIADQAGKPLLTVESVTVPRSLLSLAIDQSDLGTLSVIRPTVYVETRDGGSNWEDFIAALNHLQQEPANESMALAVEVVEGVVRGTDAVTGRQWLVDNANITAKLANAIEAHGSAEVTTAESADRGKLKFRCQPDASDGQQLELLAERLPLMPIESWLARSAPGTRVAGAVSTDAKLSWRNDPQRGLALTSTGRIEASNLELDTPALAGDRLRSRKVSSPWDIRVDGDELTITQLKVSADWANFEVNGIASIRELQTIEVNQVLQGQLPKRDLELAGKVDLAAIATMLPRSLQLREGVRIDAGQLSFDAGGQPEGDSFVWQAAAAIQQVAGSDGRREIRWQKPIQAEATLRETASGARLEALTIDAPFVQAELQTQQDAVTGNVEVDLAKFSQELGQFIDLQSWQLRGLGEGEFSIARKPSDQFEATANLQLTDLRVADAGREVWTEPKLAIECSANGIEKNLQPTALTSGSLQLRGPRDQLEATLLEPVQLTDPAQAAQLQVSGNGPLELWIDRLRPWLASAPRQLAGEASLQAQVRLSSDQVQVVESNGSVVQLRVQASGLSIDEPRVEFSGDGLIDVAGASLRSQQLQVLGRSFSIRARDIDVALAGDSPSARGSVAFRTDLERLATMVNMTGGPTSTWPQGAAVGQVNLTSVGQQVQADLGVKFDQLRIMRTTAAAGATYGQPEVLWSEPMLEVTGVANYAADTDRLQFSDMNIQGETLRLSSNASIDRLSSVGVLQANGLVEYAPEQLAQLIASYAGREVQLQGDRQVRFQVTGPLLTGQGAKTHWSHVWDVGAEAGWSSAGVYGLPLGGGKLKGTLRDGQLQIAPLDVSVGEGRLTAAPLVNLNPGAERLILQRGPLVSNVEISPAVSEQMLKYVAPVLAGATRAEGKFSIDLDQAEVPFADPQRARVQGRLTSHRLAVSPGPMMNQLISIVKQIESLSKSKQFLQAATGPRTKSFLTMAEQQVEFQVAEGRVYHRNLEFLIDDAPVRSYGSVGFDQTLALVIEVPVQDKWIDKEPLLRSLSGQSLKVPIYGTFQKPKIDDRAIADLSRQVLQGAATQAIGDELNRQFDRLFRGK